MPDRDDSGTLGAKFHCTFTPAIVGGEGQVLGSSHSSNDFPSPTPSSITVRWIHSHKLAGRLCLQTVQLSQTGGSTLFMSWATTRVRVGSGCHVTTKRINALLQLHGQPTINFNNQLPSVN